MASPGNHEWYVRDDLDAESFRPIGVISGKDNAGFSMYREYTQDDGGGKRGRVGDFLPGDTIVLADSIFYSPSANNLYYTHMGSWSTLAVK